MESQNKFAMEKLQMTKNLQIDGFKSKLEISESEIIKMGLNSEKIAVDHQKKLKGLVSSQLVNKNEFNLRLAFGKLIDHGLACRCTQRLSIGKIVNQILRKDHERVTLAYFGLKEGLIVEIGKEAQSLADKKSGMVKKLMESGVARIRNAFDVLVRKKRDIERQLEERVEMLDRICDVRNFFIVRRVFFSEKSKFRFFSMADGQ